MTTWNPSSTVWGRARTGADGTLNEHPLARAAMAMPSTDTSTRRIATSPSRISRLIKIGPAPRRSRPRIVDVEVRTPTICLDGGSRQSDHRPLFHELAKGGRERVSILILCPKRDPLRDKPPEAGGSDRGGLRRCPFDYPGIKPDDWGHIDPDGIGAVHNHGEAAGNPRGLSSLVTL